MANVDEGNNGIEAWVRTPPSLTEFFYYLFESKILLSAGSPIITQLVDLFFDGGPFYFATNLKKSFCSVFLSQGLDPPPPPPSKIPGSAPAFISR